MKDRENIPEEDGGGTHVFLSALLDVVVLATGHYLGLRETGVTPPRMAEALSRLTESVRVLAVVFGASVGGRCVACSDLIGADGVGEWGAFCADCADSPSGTFDAAQADSEPPHPFGDALNR